MAKKVFISYNHAQQDFVRRDLETVLRAAGCEVLIDYKHFGLGPTLPHQMDALQDAADVSLLCLSTDYLASCNCVHEMDRAIAKDPGFTLDKTIVVKVQPGLAHSALPATITGPNSLYGDLSDPADGAAWSRLLVALEGELGCGAPEWLKARSKCVSALRNQNSVNLYVPGSAKWEPLVDSLQEHFGITLPVVDLQAGETHSRSGLIAAILRALRLGGRVPDKPHDLGFLQQQIESAGCPCALLLKRFHNVQDRHAEYNVDLFRSLRYLQDRMAPAGRAVLLLQSRRPLAAIVPSDHPDSQILAQHVPLD